MQIWTRDALTALKEDDLSRQVLVPLFQAMGYRDVRFFGGGVLEQGKDLVMWLEEPVRGRVNYAVVVKATPITGEAVTGRVIDQLRQAFGKPFLDPANQEERQVHECFVVTPREIKKEGTHTLDGLLEQERFRDHVTFIDGVRLWDLVEQYLANRVLLGKLVETYQRMRTAVPQHDFAVELGEDGVTLTVRTPSASVPETIDPVFPDTPEGKSSKAAFEQFVKTGEPTELPLASVGGLPSPELLEMFGGSASVGIVRLTAQLPRPLQGALRFESADGQTVSLPHVEFAVTAGTERVHFTNESQPIPFKIQITANLTSAPSGNFQYTFNAEGWSAQWLLTQQKILRMLSKGCRIFFTDLSTGIDHRMGVLGSGGVPPPDATFFALVERIAWIELRVKEPILAPARPFFTFEDRQDIEFVRTVLSKGQHPVTSAQFTMQPGPEHRQHWVEILRKPQVVIMFTQDASSWRILDTDIPLGPVETRCTGGRISPVAGTVDDTVSALLNGEPVALKLTANKGKRLFVRYSWWYRKS